MWRRLLFAALVLALTEQGASSIARASAAPAPQDASIMLSRLADEYVAIDRAGGPAGEFPIRDAITLNERHRAEDQVFDRLHQIQSRKLSGQALVEYRIMDERLRSQRDLRVCHAELWDLNHITGWQVRLPQQAAAQSTASGADREKALRRWNSLPAYIDADIGNLRRGLASDYRVPKSVVLRVLREVDALGSMISAADGPFDGPAARSVDREFQVQWRALVADKIAASIRRFAQFLRSEYLPRARETVGLWDLPNGARCYAALLRRETTFDVSAQSTFNLGQSTVAENAKELERIGSKLFGTSDVMEILKRAKLQSANHFESPQDIVNYANQTLARSINVSSAYFLKLPQQALQIEPLPAYQQGSGIGSHYEATDINRTAVYRINLDRWQEQTRGAIAVTAVHEGVPGHHLQRDAARSNPLASSIAQMAYNSAYVEGWANYAERLGEEMGVFDNPYSAVFRRSVLGQSLILDPAIHVKRWDRQRVRNYLGALGQSEQEADELMDRVAVQPAQLTSYDYGGLEIWRLRERAKAVLGSRFDIREFHQRVLENGAVPLTTLHEQIQNWISSTRVR